MPAPLAKGIIVGVSVLVAAGIAVYESPQFRRWVDQSRRKIAIAIYSLGAENHPREPQSQDISMTEEISEHAAERRRIAREEILLRRDVMRVRKDSSATSFDTLVDQEGRLLSKKDKSEMGESFSIAESNDEIANARSTAVDNTHSTSLHQRGGPSEADALTDTRLQPQLEMVEAMERDHLHLDLQSETSSQHPSDSLIELTPTSEFPEENQNTTPSYQQEQMDYFSASSLSNSTESMNSSPSDYFYARPDRSDPHSPEMSSHQTDALQDHELSTTSSLAGSLEHVYHETSSDGTLSEWGQPTDGILTPTSWSEVGSVISSDEEHHHQR